MHTQDIWKVYQKVRRKTPGHISI